MWISKTKFELIQEKCRAKCELAEAQEKLIKSYKIKAQATDEKIEVMEEYISALNKTIQLLEEQNQLLKERIKV